MQVIPTVYLIWEKLPTGYPVPTVYPNWDDHPTHFRCFGLVLEVVTISGVTIQHRKWIVVLRLLVVGGSGET